MEMKTQVFAGEGKQDVTITRIFDLPVDMLFKAYAEAEFVAQWMGTTVLKLESQKHGSYAFETTDAKGKVVFKADGVIHEFKMNKKIIRTFEMANTPFGVQLEVYVFEQLDDDSSKLTMHVIYESFEQRDEVMKLPFAQGINWAHNRLEEVMQKK